MNQTSHKSEPLVTVDNISLVADGKTILDKICFAIYPQTITTIVGPNGGGKSSIIKVILGLRQATSGKVTFSNPKLRLGYLPQKLHLDQSLPLNVEQLLRLSPKFNLETYTWLVKNLELENLLTSSVHSLSGGERQRVFLARSLLAQPELLILDEPAQGVDIRRQSDLYRLINIVKDKFNCAVLLVSHDLMLVMANTDHVICLNKHICCEGEPLAISQHPEFSNIFGSYISKNIQDQFAIYAHDRQPQTSTSSISDTPQCHCNHQH